MSNNLLAPAFLKDSQTQRYRGLSVLVWFRGMVLMSTTTIVTMMVG
jgi:hypothetical protein